MVKIMENPIKMGDLGGYPIIFGNTQMGIGWASKCEKKYTFLKEKFSRN